MHTDCTNKKTIYLFKEHVYPGNEIKIYIEFEFKIDIDKWDGNILG